MVSIIIVNFNTVELLKNCLLSLIKYHNHKIDNYELIIVDNNSKEKSIEDVFKIYPKVILIKLNENVGFSRANNIAAKQAKGDVLLFLNNDTLFIENSIDKMEGYLSNNEEIGVLGPKLLNADFSFQLSAGKLPNVAQEIIDKLIYFFYRKLNIMKILIEKFLFRKIKEVEWVTGACMMVRRELFSLVNGFDESIFLYFEDKDLCARIRNKNKKIVYYPETSVIHLLGGSSSKMDKSEVRKIYRESQKYYYKKHLSKLQNIILYIYQKFTND